MYRTNNPRNGGARLLPTPTVASRKFPQMEVSPAVNKQNAYDYANRDNQVSLTSQLKTLTAFKKASMVENEILRSRVDFLERKLLESVAEMKKSAENEDETLDQVSQMISDHESKLMSKDVERLQNDKDWQAKYNTMEDKWTKDLAEQHQSWELKLKDCQSSHEALSRKFEAELAKTKVNQVKDDNVILDLISNMLADNESKLMSKENERLQNDIDWQAKYKTMEDNKAAWQTKAKQLENEKMDLENGIGLPTKNKRVFWFTKKQVKQEKSETKGCWSWLRRNKTRDGDLEEAARWTQVGPK